METASHAGHHLIYMYGEQDKSGDNIQQLAQMFPHSCLLNPLFFETCFYDHIIGWGENEFIGLRCVV